MKGKAWKAITLVMIGVVVGATASLATPPSGLSSTLLARGSWIDPQQLGEFAAALEAGGETLSEVAIVQASLAPGGTTGWHTHSGPSALVVSSGTLEVSEERPGGGCDVHSVSARKGGRAFFHSTDVHRFDNPSKSATATFYIAYFVPPGPILIDADAPPGC